MHRREGPGAGAGPHPTLAADGQGPRPDDTHDYKRIGTTTLLAVLDLLTGEVTRCCFERKRREEFLKVLVTKGKATHMILDSCSANSAEVQRRLCRHKGFGLTSSRPPLPG